ncbi:MAG: YfhO family protein [Bacteroidetes bacterium]|nr:YfhO family protein [Bacteroidota bacterium]MBS1756513.1 YfhO family protein [Bacteroidota bacterium]
MKQISFKKILPHLIAIGIFLLVAAIISKPAFESDTILKQSDLIGWQGMSHQSFEYKQTHGHFPLWVTSMFSGMPAYQIVLEGDWSPLGFFDKAFQLWLPQPMNFFFLACICFYILCLCLKIRPFASVLGSLGFAYCSFSAIIITAGHVTQMFALAYSPALIGAAILIFDKKYFTGFTLATLITALQIAQGHQQVSYYLFLILGIMSVAYIIHFIKSKQIPHLAKSLGLLIAAGIIGVCINAVSLFPTYDYAKESKRGGQLVMDKSNVKPGEKIVNGKTTGLSREYAFQWSYGQSELLGLLYPGVAGYGTHYAERDGESYMFPKLSDDSHVVKYLTDKLGVPESSIDQAASQFSQSLYWGRQPFTNGPVYLGAVICFLFVLGMFYLDNKHKWWILAACIFAMLLALGNNLSGFNYFMFDYLPLYNKFRVPTMALVIPQILFPVIAALTINKLIDNDDAESWQKFKKGAIATAALFAVAFVFYFSSDFTNENRQRTNEFNTLYNAQDSGLEQKLETYPAESDNRLYEGMVANFKGNPDAQKAAREFVSALKQDRASLLLSDIIRSLIYILIAAALIALYLKKKLNATLLLAGLTLTALVDLMSFDMKYLNDKSFDSKEKYEEQEFPMTNADRQILQDKDPNYRVFNLSVGSPFEESKTSYYHKSIGGYHAAKLGIYDDLTTYQLSGQMPNLGVLDMLNAKYVIQRQGNDVVASRNPGALGNAWFVKGVKFVQGPVAEMQALTGFNPKDTAVVDEQFKNLTTGYAAADSTSLIKMTSFDNDDITYESSSASANIAVFSEIYYKDWKAYLDGKKVPYFKANYVLRAMLIPPGKHTIEFKFESQLFNTSKKIADVFTWLLMLFIAIAVFLEIKKIQKEKR